MFLDTIAIYLHKQPVNTQKMNVQYTDPTTHPTL